MFYLVLVIPYFYFVCSLRLTDYYSFPAHMLRSMRENIHIISNKVTLVSSFLFVRLNIAFFLSLKLQSEYYLHIRTTYFIVNVYVSHESFITFQLVSQLMAFLNSVSGILSFYQTYPSRNENNEVTVEYFLGRCAML